MWAVIRCCGRVPDTETCIAWKIKSPQIFDLQEAVS